MATPEGAFGQIMPRTREKNICYVPPWVLDAQMHTVGAFHWVFNP
jgi:hypothetical protein